MTFDASPNGRDRPAGTLPERAPDFDLDFDVDFEDLLLAGLPDDPGETDPAEDAFPAPDLGPEPAEPVPRPVFDFEDALVDGLSSGTEAPDLPGAPSPSAAPDDPDPGPGAAEHATAADVADALSADPLDDLRPLPADPDLPDLADLSGIAADLPIPGDAVDAGSDTDADDAARARTPEGPAAALAFAADPETENALREGLLHFERTIPDCDDPQVWPGGLRAAVAALADGHSSGLVIVDIDGIAYPSGAIHELAEVCEFGTSVIAVGSNGTARFSREILLAGVSEYLVKPLTAETVREATRRAAASRTEAPARGCVAGFAGTGGSGATTLAVATALHAAETGRYVSVLDLNRTVPVAALLLDVQPAAGLEQVIEVAADAPLEAKTLDSGRAQRSERISVYAYRWSPVLPAAPSAPALARLLGELRTRSQLVLVDGMDDPPTRFALLSKVDVPVLVAEPTADGATRAARMLELFPGDVPAVAVQNHTRAFSPEAGARTLVEAGMDAAPDILVPYLRSLPEIADRGWPRGRLPRRLRRPVAALLDRILVSARLAGVTPDDRLREAA